MSVPAATLAPRPVIRVAGQVLECGLDGADLTVPVVLDSIAVSWGREDIWETPQPATLTMRLLDRAGVWARKITTATAHGSAVSVTAVDTGFEHLIWQGKVSGVKARPRRGDYADHWLVTITAIDPTGQLSQTIPEGEDWPQETLQARAVRARNHAQAAAGIGQLYFEPGAVTWPVAPWKTQGDALSLVNLLYQSIAASWAYIPHENVIRHVSRINPESPLYLKRVPATDGRHVVIVETAAGPYDPGSSTTPWPSTTLGACWVSGTEEDMTQTRTQALNRVVVKWRNWAGRPGDSITTYTNEPNSPVAGKNELVLESWLSDGLNVDPTAQATLARAIGEGRRPVHPTIVYDTRATDGGFRDRAAAVRCLTPAETNGMITLAGSPFADWLGYAPVFRPSGGRIEYRAGRWVISYLPQWVAVRALAGTSITYAGLAHVDKLTYDGANTVLDQSISYKTLAHLMATQSWIDEVWT